MKYKVLEAKDLRKTPRATKVDLAPYLDALKKIPEGGALEVSLDSEDSSRTVKRRYTSAAKELGKEIVYRTSKEADFRIMFRPDVADAEASPAETG